MVSTKTSTWHTTASVQLDAYLLIPWLSWGKSFLLNTTEGRQREQQEAKKRAVAAAKVAEKKWQQEAEAGSSKCRAEESIPGQSAALGPRGQHPHERGVPGISQVQAHHYNYREDDILWGECAIFRSCKLLLTITPQENQCKRCIGKDTACVCLFRCKQCIQCYDDKKGCSLPTPLMLMLVKWSKVDTAPHPSQGKSYHSALHSINTYCDFRKTSCHHRQRLRRRG